MDILSLQCFIALAETKSFTQTAEQVCRTQSAVSQKIAKLEQLLGKTLIIRGKHIELSNDGELFLNYARQLTTIYAEMIDRFQHPELEGEITFGLPEDFATVLLADVLSEFSHIHPRVVLNVECDLTLNLFKRFKRGEFDLVLVKLNRSEDFPYGSDIWSEKLVWVGTNEEIFQQQPLPLVLSPQPCVYRSRAIEALEKKKIPWRLAFCSPSYAGTIAAVKAGLGISVMPKNMVHHDLQIINHRKLPKLNQIHVSLIRRKKTNPAIDTFEHYVTDQLKLSS